jgi:hypothetical protein
MDSVYRVMNLGSLKGGEFVDQLSDYELLTNDSAPWNRKLIS